MIRAVLRAGNRDVDVAPGRPGPRLHCVGWTPILERAPRSACAARPGALAPKFASTPDAVLRAGENLARSRYVDDGLARDVRATHTAPDGLCVQLPGRGRDSGPRTPGTRARRRHSHARESNGETDGRESSPPTDEPA